MVRVKAKPTPQGDVLDRSLAHLQKARFSPAPISRVIGGIAALCKPVGELVCCLLKLKYATASATDQRVRLRGNP